MISWPPWLLAGARHVYNFNKSVYSTTRIGNIIWYTKPAGQVQAEIICFVYRTIFPGCRLVYRKMDKMFIVQNSVPTGFRITQKLCTARTWNSLKFCDLIPTEFKYKFPKCHQNSVIRNFPGRDTMVANLYDQIVFPARQPTYIGTEHIRPDGTYVGTVHDFSVLYRHCYRPDQGDAIIQTWECFSKQPSWWKQNTISELDTYILTNK